MIISFLIGAKVVLRPVEREDVSYVQKWVNDPEIRKYWTTLGGLGTVPGTGEMVEDYINELSNGKNIGLIIQEKGSSRPIGLVSLLDIDWVNKKAMLEIAIGEKGRQHKGLATEAVKLVLGYAFKTLSLNRIWLGLYEENKVSLKLYDRTGFAVEGVLLEDLYREGHYQNRLVMGLLRRNWRD